MHKKVKVVLLITIGLFYILLHLLKIQFTPFFIYGMYSKKVEYKEYYEIYEFEVNDNKVQAQSLGNDKMELAIGPLNYYMEHIKNEGVDPVEKFVLSKRPNWEQSTLYNSVAERVFNNHKKMDSFPKWYKNMLEDLLGYKVNSLAVYSITLKYANYGLETVKREKVLSIE